MSEPKAFDVIVLGAGPAGTAAALRAADLGAKTALIARDAFGGMAATEGPIPVRTLAHAARLVREARQMHRYGITVELPNVDYAALLARAAEIVGEARNHSTLLEQIERAGVTLFEHAGSARFVDAHRITSERGPLLAGERIVICTGGVSRAMDVPGAELSVTPSAAFTLTAAPKSLVVIGAGATGAQVASIFNAFGSSVTLCQGASRIVPTEDADVSAEVARAFREDGIAVRENCRIIGFEKTSKGVRIRLAGDEALEAEIAVSTVGWVGDAGGLNLVAAGVRTDARGFIEVDDFRRTTAPHVYAAGDVIGRSMLVPQGVRDGFVAGNNAASDNSVRVPASVEPIGSFTDPEYAKVGLTEEEAREKHDVLVARASYAETTRPIVDGRARGFCKLVVERNSHEILGCHLVGERAVEVAQMAAIAMSAKMKVGDVAAIPLSFPTYANVFGRAALRAVRLLGARPTIDG
ncbi:MAG TPA: NAD(P)/FAD-dependent oxidoreductase [Candidatus Tumulicola sp.]|jgi:dihydrolipoamide dehydrogenase